MSKAAILTALTALSTTHESVLSDVRTHTLSPQPSSPYDASRPLFLAVTLSPSEWANVARIEKRGAEIDALFAAARRDLSNSGDMLATAVAQHEGTPESISAAMASLNADIASLTAALLAKSVVFAWSSLPSK